MSDGEKVKASVSTPAPVASLADFLLSFPLTRPPSVSCFPPSLVLRRSSAATVILSCYCQKFSLPPVFSPLSAQKLYFSRLPPLSPCFGSFPRSLTSLDFLVLSVSHSCSRLTSKPLCRSTSVFFFSQPSPFHFSPILLLLF